MKEENKKKTTTTKKSTVKKAATKKAPAKKSTTKKTTVAKTAVKKAPAKKTVATKKNSSVKKSVTKKVTPKKKPTVKVEEVKVKEEIKKIEVVPVEEEVIEFTKPVEEVKEVVKHEEEYKANMPRRAVYTIAGTLIMIFVVIGFIEFIIKPISIKNNENKSYIIQEKIVDSSKILQLDSANEKLSKLNGNYFIYIATTDNENNKYFEKELKNVLDSYDLNSKFYYLNVDEIKDKDNYLKILNDKLNYSDNYVTSVPAIVYVNTDNIVTRDNIISKEENKIFKIGDFQKLLDINGFKERK